MRLGKKTAIVTGAADGIGRVVAGKLAKEGAIVILADVQDEKGLEAVEAIREDGGTASYVHCDVGMESDVKQLVDQTIRDYGAIHILVNNAAVAIDGIVTEMPEEAWQKLMNINLAGVYRGCKHVIPHMLNNGGGSIVSMASCQAHVGFTGWTAYAASKGGIIAMTQQMAVEFAPYNIRVNCISPGTINTPMTKRLVAETPGLLEEWTAFHPIGRIGESEEVANAIVFLASDESSFITGVDLKVDGAMTLRP